MGNVNRVLCSCNVNTHTFSCKMKAEWSASLCLKYKTRFHTSSIQNYVQETHALTINNFLPLRENVSHLHIFITICLDERHLCNHTHTQLCLYTWRHIHKYHTQKAIFIYTQRERDRQTQRDRERQRNKIEFNTGETLWTVSIYGKDRQNISSRRHSKLVILLHFIMIINDY